MLFIIIEHDTCNVCREMKGGRGVELGGRGPSHFFSFFLSYKRRKTTSVLYPTCRSNERVLAKGVKESDSEKDEKRLRELSPLNLGASPRQRRNRVPQLRGTVLSPRCSVQLRCSPNRTTVTPCHCPPHPQHSLTSAPESLIKERSEVHGFSAARLD